MRNIDRIRQMSLEELAPLLVKRETMEGDYFYTSPSSSSEEFITERDVIEDCIRWLDTEYKETNLSCEGK